MLTREPQKISRRKILKSAAALGLIQMMPGVVRLAAAQGEVAKPFVVGVPSSPEGLSTIVAQADYVGRFIERSLLDYDRAGASFTLVPGLAKEMPEVSEDGLRFHPGRDFPLAKGQWSCGHNMGSAFFEAGQFLIGEQVGDRYRVMIQPEFLHQNRFHFAVTEGHCISFPQGTPAASEGCGRANPVRANGLTAIQPFLRQRPGPLPGTSPGCPWDFRCRRMT